jgi:DNA-binding transcriptional MerR regulator
VIRIGDFARLSQVSVVTLRHYDEVGLLKPVLVDPFTGYRYYSVAQLPRLNRILALKDLGFSLDQIADVLVADLTPDQLRGMLKLKRAEVEQRLASEQARLVAIEARLRQIEMEDSVSDFDVVLKTVPAMLVAACRVTIPTNDQVPAYLGPAYAVAYDYVRSQGAKDTGPCLAVWHTPADVYANEDAEAVVPIDRPLPGTGRVRVYELPQVQVAAVVHHGNFEDFTQGHKALLTWIEANGYRIAGPYREIYIKHDKRDLSDTTTEIQIPVAKT